ncbi:hypothetical protein RD110_08945 [Rhodoferax koreense]|uniref:Lysozyme inhibitor n=1 Tax=Rhodoferax koreensis TaxID=1842727 RepID=A0A1P8JU82_9BURK|nr:hypothetical protein RD110_08945 [Rhodoferax koreense]
MAACVGSSQAQERLKPDLLRQYGGVYSSACDKLEAPRLRVLPDALVVQHAGKRMTGRQPQSAYVYYGKTAPPQFRVGLMSRAPNGGALDFIVFVDRRGPYISVLGDKLVQAELGKTVTNPRYRRCEDPLTQPTARATPSVPAQDEPVSDAEKMLLDPQFRAAHLRALGPLAKERWLARLEGPRPPTRQVRLEGVDYTLVAVCKPHDCADHNSVLLYGTNIASEQVAVFGKVVQDGKSTLVGEPPPVVAAALDRIWATEWRRK